MPECRRVNRVALGRANEAAIYIVSQGLVSQAKIIYGVSEPMLNYRLRISGAQRIHERRLEIIRRVAGATG